MRIKLYGIRREKLEVGAQDICQEKALGFQLTSSQISIKMVNLNKKKFKSMVEQQRFPRPGNGIQ